MNLQVPLVYVFSGGGCFYSKGSDKRTQTNNIFYTNGWSVMTFNFGRCRFLRNKDRQLNKDKYPNLNHPEVYLLHGGYKAFYQNYKVLLHLLPILLFINIRSILIFSWISLLSWFVIFNVHWSKISYKNCIERTNDHEDNINVSLKLSFFTKSTKFNAHEHQWNHKSTKVKTIMN